MLPTVLFGIIVLVSLAGAVSYYFAANPPVARARSSTSKSGAVPDGIGVAPLPPGGSAERLDSGHQAPHSLESLFLPEEDGIYHSLDHLNQRRRTDLDYTLIDICRLPIQIAELLDLLNNSDSSPAHVARVSSRLPGLDAMVLRTVNSPYYSLDSRVDDLPSAVAALGFNEVHQIVLTSCLFLNHCSLQGPVDIKDLYRHSLASARLTGWIAEIASVPLRLDLAGTGAMLHDIGKIVLQRWRPAAFQRAVQASRENHSSLMAEELKELGVTHALAGAMLLSYLRLPVTLSWVVKGSHLPVVSSDMPESALVYVAEHLTRFLAVGSDAERADERIPDDVRFLLGLEPHTIPELVNDRFRDYVRSALPDLKVRVKS